MDIPMKSYTFQGGMELNGIATAKLILNQIKRGAIPPEELEKECEKAIRQLDEQIEYIKENNPGRVFGYPQTYYLEGKSNG